MIATTNLSNQLNEALINFELINKFVIKITDHPSSKNLKNNQSLQYRVICDFILHFVPKNENLKSDSMNYGLLDKIDYEQEITYFLEKESIERFSYSNLCYMNNFILALVFMASLLSGFFEDFEKEKSFNLIYDDILENLIAVRFFIEILISSDFIDNELKRKIIEMNML